MASRLASGGINLAASSSSYNVSAAAGPDVNYHWPRERGGDKTQHNTTQHNGGGGSVDCVLFLFPIIEMPFSSDFLFWPHMNNVRSCWFFELSPRSLKLPGHGLMDRVFVVVQCCQDIFMSYDLFNCSYTNIFIFIYLIL